MDNFYLNLAVYKFEEMAKDLHNPECQCEFAYGRPMKGHGWQPVTTANLVRRMAEDRKSTRLNSSHSQISYAVFCLKKKKIIDSTSCTSTMSVDIVSNGQRNS